MLPDVNVKKRAGNTRARILVADDDPELRFLVVDLLRRAGYEVLEASSGSEAMSILLRRAFADPSAASIDLVLADISMPGCTGMQVLADLAGRRWRPPIAVITGNSDPEVHRQARDLGALAVLEKPVEPAEILGLVEWALAGEELATHVPFPRGARENAMGGHL